MLTPKFELSQDEEFIILIVHAPYTNVAKARFYSEEDVIVFYSKPYYLRLHLPKQVLHHKRNVAEYDVDKGTYTARILKENKGEVFEGLDMLTKLLTPPEPKGKSQINANLVEVISSSDTDSKQVSCVGSAVCDDVNGDEDNDDVTDLNLDLPVLLEAEGGLLGTSGKYGFAQKKSDFSQKLMLEFCEVFDVKDPNSSTKRQERLAHETEQFSDDHYLADLHETREIADFLSFQPWWTDMTAACELSPEAQELMLKLPKKNYLLDDGELQNVYLSLVDILFAYAYNHRVLCGENNVESGWTISKLAATLSWLDSFTSLQDVVVSCFRRALTFPLYRHWELCVQVLEDVQVLLSGGQTCLLKCLLDVYQCMIASDPRFVLNDLYITDYCVWIQSAHIKHIHSVAETLKKVVVTKTDVGLELEELEYAAQLVLQEQNDDEQLEAIMTKMGQMHVGSSKPDLDSDDDSDESSSNTESSSGDEETDEEDEDGEKCSEEKNGVKESEEQDDKNAERVSASELKKQHVMIAPLHMSPESEENTRSNLE